MDQSILVGWNPINVIEGEGHWVGVVSVLFLLCWLLTRLFHVLVKRIQKYPNAVSVRYAVEALYSPFVSFLWFCAFLFSLDTVTEHWLSEGWKMYFFPMLHIVSVLAFGWFLFRYKKAYISYVIAKKQKEDPEIGEVLRAFSKMLSLVIVIVLLFLMHDSIGLSMSTVLTFGGVGGLALAFASQEIVQNFFGGFMLYMTRPFFHGDTIVIPQNTIEGVVEKIGWYQTVVRCTDRYAMYVPNALFTRACVLNKSRINGRLLDTSLYIEMPKSELFETFCKKMSETLLAMSEINSQERLSVWVKALYGTKACIQIQCVFKPIPLQNVYPLTTRVMLSSQTIAEALGGSLSTPPSMTASPS